MILAEEYEDAKFILDKLIPSFSFKWLTDDIDVLSSVAKKIKIITYLDLAFSNPLSILFDKETLKNIGIDPTEIKKIINDFLDFQIYVGDAKSGVANMKKIEKYDSGAFNLFDVEELRQSGAESEQKTLESILKNISNMSSKNIKYLLENQLMDKETVHKIVDLFKNQTTGANTLKTQDINYNYSVFLQDFIESKKPLGSIFYNFPEIKDIESYKKKIANFKDFIPEEELLALNKKQIQDLNLVKSPMNFIDMRASDELFIQDAFFDDEFIQNIFATFNPAVINLNSEKTLALFDVLIKNTEKVQGKKLNRNFLTLMIFLSMFKSYNQTAIGVLEDPIEEALGNSISDREFSELKARVKKIKDVFLNAAPKTLDGMNQHYENMKKYGFVLDKRIIKEIVHVFNYQFVYLEEYEVDFIMNNLPELPAIAKKSRMGIMVKNVSKMKKKYPEISKLFQQG